MFGKAEWFKQTDCCNFVYPVSTSGWRYLAVWSAAAALPAAGLALIGKTFPEALVWAAAATLAFWWDVRDIRRQLRIAHERTLPFIGDEDESSDLATRQFDMKLRG
jgi:hypothetical protein